MPPVCYSITYAMLGSHQAHMSEWWYMKAWTVREYTGLGLIALSGVVAAALMTWSVQDPNFSYAPSGPIHNVIAIPARSGPIF